jgi:hypothetical protein
MAMQNEWTWTPTNKIPYEKTARYFKREEPSQMERPPDFENLAYNHSLNTSENNGWESDTFLETQFNINTSNKREDAYNKIAEREMVGQIGHNPFLDRNDYVKNIVAQDLFLKPVDTNADRVKKKEMEE